jgi:hypothetical protein
MSRESEVQLDRCGTFEDFADEVSRADGVDLARLERLTELSVETENTRYQIFVIDPHARKVIIRGGRYFAEPVEAVINGASCGGSFVKLGVIAVGMRMEIYAAGGHIVTSRVRSIQEIDPKIDGSGLPRAS